MRSILDDPSLTRWTWAVLALLLAATAFLTIQGRWLGVAVLGGTVACSVAFIRLQHRLPRLFNLLFVLAGAVNAVAYGFDLWDRIGVYDEFVHFYITFAVAAAFGYLAFHRPYLSDADRLWRFVAVVAAFGFGVGVLWEVFEWAIGMIGDRVDTIVDLVMDTLGGAAAGLFCAWAINRRRGENAARRPATTAGLPT
jgi:hypothetical protein